MIDYFRTTELFIVGIVISWKEVETCLPYLPQFVQLSFEDSFVQEILQINKEILEMEVLGACLEWNCRWSKEHFIVYVRP